MPAQFGDRLVEPVFADVLDRQFHPARWMHDVVWNTFVLCEIRAQRLMPRHHVVERFGERGNVQLTGEAKRQRHAEAVPRALQPVHQPRGQLRIRQRGSLRALRLGAQMIDTLTYAVERGDRFNEKLER